MLNNLKKLIKIRQKLATKKTSVGTWMQIASPDIAEILSSSKLDWITLDMEHANFDNSDIVNIFRAIELGNAAPFVRVQSSDSDKIKHVLDCGAAGIIIPNIESAAQLNECIRNCNWPPHGIRGVGYSRANLYGINFKKYKDKKVKPLVIAIIESKKGFENLNEILDVENLDGIFIGPYDLSASYNILGKFNSKKFKLIIKNIKKLCALKKVPCGIHVVETDLKKLKDSMKNFQFVAYSIDAQLISDGIRNMNKIL